MTDSYSNPSCKPTSQSLPNPKPLLANTGFVGDPVRVCVL